MTERKMSVADIRTEYNDFIDSCAKFIFYTRSKKIQSEKVVECERFLLFIKSCKRQAAEQNYEEFANELFTMQCMTNATRSFLLMWISLKEEGFNHAWSHLVDAQEYVEIVLKILDDEGPRTLENQLAIAEKSLFPGWALYNSPGFVETIGNCSICGEPFLLCEHVESEIYMGSMCQRVGRDIVRMDHIAFVDNPRDKRCVITKVTDDDGEELDYFTWEKSGNKKDVSEGMHAEAVVFVIPKLDLH